MNLSFAGCGFLGIYHVGVAACFRKYAPHLIVDKVSGASAGAIAACCLLCNSPLGEITSDVLQVATEARSRSLGPFSPSFNITKILHKGLTRILPEDAAQRVNGKLHISMTRVHDGKNVIVSHFKNKADVIQAILCSTFIPIFSGWLPPMFRGARHIDGGYSDNMPLLDENTITVSPFSGESDICPRDDNCCFIQFNLANTSIELSLQNLCRFARILFPPKPEILSKMCQQGFDDALKFLQRNNLISCTRCLSVQSTFQLSHTLDDSFEYDPHCNECQLHRQESQYDSLPEVVVSILQDAIDSANKGLVNWIFKHRSAKLLTVLALPCVLPADIAYAIFLRLVDMTPQVKHSVQLLAQYLIANIHHLVLNVEKKKLEYSPNYTCHHAITKLDADSDVVGHHDQPVNVNFGFTVDPETRHHIPPSHAEALLIQSDTPGQASCRHSIDIDDDTFDRIFDVTADHEALLAYYYLDENNEVKFTGIYDVTTTKQGAGHSSEGQQLTPAAEFTDHWDEGLTMPSQRWTPYQSSDEDKEFHGKDVYSRTSSLSCEDSSLEIDPCDSKLDDSGKRYEDVFGSHITSASATKFAVTGDSMYHSVYSSDSSPVPSQCDSYPSDKDDSRKLQRKPSFVIMDQ